MAECNENKLYNCVGYAYVPNQELEHTCEPCMSLENGSIFPELVLSICEYGTVCKSEGGTV